MPRSIWTGSISFGLVNIPVRLYSATESHRVGFHEFDRKTKKRVHYRRVAEGSSAEVPWEHIEKGFEIRKGRFVILTDEELQAAEPQRTHAIEIEQFVVLEDIDPVNWDQTYFVGPDGAASSKAYGLLREAMAGHRRVAIGRFVMRTKEYVVCIRPFEKGLALQTMFFPDEVRSPSSIEGVAGKVTVGKRELALAGQLIESLSAPWDPSAYKDTFRERVMALVRKKDKGEEVAAPTPSEGSGKVLDLMAALKATLAGDKGKSGQASGGKKPGERRGGARATTGAGRRPSRKPMRRPQAPRKAVQQT